MSPPSKELMHFNPRSPHGERRAADDQRVAAVGISTHAPRTGSDGFIASHKPTSLISTHAPRTGSDGLKSPRPLSPPFQPTLPARGATSSVSSPSRMRPISTHAPRTGSDASIGTGWLVNGTISTHAPRTGSDARRA